MSPSRRPLRLLTLSAALVFATVACGSDDDGNDMNDDVDQTEVTSASGSAVPGQEQAPVNTDTGDSQLTPTIAP